MRTDSEEAIRRSIIHSLLGDLDEQESRTLENWLKTPEHQDFYKKISNREYVRCKMAGLELSDKEKARERLKMNIARRIERYRRRKWLGRVAGIVLLLCMGEGVWFYWQNEVKQTDQDLAERVTASSLPVIRLASGKEIALNRDSAYNLDGGFLLAEDGYARYEPTANVKRADSSQYNEIRTPRGTDYKMILPDGTKVWMNADSKLKYPVAFGQSQREVFLEGEAYFDVKKDPEYPFTVHTSRGDVQVLGTGFNIRDYRGEARVVTTLVEGKVVYKASERHEAVIILPGYQLIDNGYEELAPQEVDVEMYVGWKDGRYIFEDATLEEIMQVLSKWYNVTVFYKNEKMKNLHFTGDIERYENINDFLHFMELGGKVVFNIQDKTIIIE